MPAPRIQELQTKITELEIRLEEAEAAVPTLRATITKLSPQPGDLVLITLTDPGSISACREIEEAFEKEHPGVHFIVPTVGVDMTLRRERA